MPACAQTRGPRLLPKIAICARSRGNKGNSAEAAHIFSGLPCSPSAGGRGEQGDQSGSRCPPREGSAESEGTAPVDLEDWVASYDERAAIREFDGHLPREAAEALAYEDAVAALGPRPETPLSSRVAEAEPEVCSPCSPGSPLQSIESKTAGSLQ